MDSQGYLTDSKGNSCWKSKWGEGENQQNYFTPQSIAIRDEFI